MAAYLRRHGVPFPATSTMNTRVCQHCERVIADGHEPVLCPDCSTATFCSHECLERGRADHQKGECSRMFEKSIAATDTGQVRMLAERASKRVRRGRPERDSASMPTHVMVSRWCGGLRPHMNGIVVDIALLFEPVRMIAMAGQRDKRMHLIEHCRHVANRFHGQTLDEAKASVSEAALAMMVLALCDGSFCLRFISDGAEEKRRARNRRNRRNRRRRQEGMDGGGPDRTGHMSRVPARFPASWLSGTVEGLLGGRVCVRDGVVELGEDWERLAPGQRAALWMHLNTALRDCVQAARQLPRRLSVRSTRTRSCRSVVMVLERGTWARLWLQGGCLPLRLDARFSRPLLGSSRFSFGGSVVADRADPWRPASVRICLDGSWFEVSSGRVDGTDMRLVWAGDFLRYAWMVLTGSVTA